MVELFQPAQVLSERRQVVGFPARVYVGLVRDGEQNQKAIQNRRLCPEDLFQARTQAELIDIPGKPRFLDLAFFDGGDDYRQEIALELGGRGISQQKKGGPCALIANQIARGPTILLHDRTQLIGILFARRS